LGRGFFQHPSQDKLYYLFHNVGEHFRTFNYLGRGPQKLFHKVHDRHDTDQHHTKYLATALPKSHMVVVDGHAIAVVLGVDSVQDIVVNLTDREGMRQQQQQQQQQRDDDEFGESSDLSELEGQIWLASR